MPSWDIAYVPKFYITFVHNWDIAYTPNFQTAPVPKYDTAYVAPVCWTALQSSRCLAPKHHSTTSSLLQEHRHRREVYEDEKEREGNRSISGWIGLRASAGTWRGGRELSQLPSLQSRYSKMQSSNCECFTECLFIMFWVFIFISICICMYMRNYSLRFKFWVV